MVANFQEKKLSSFLLLVLLSLSLFLLDSFGTVAPIRGGVEKGTDPLKEGIFHTISNIKYQISNLKYSRKEIGELRKKVEGLEREAAQLKIENSKLKIDNRNMRRLLQVPLPLEWRFLPAHTLGRARYLAIDKGRRDGVKKGMVAIFENVLVGKIAEVSEKSAKIMPPLDPESKIAVKIRNIKGILLGLSDRLVLTEILQEEKFRVDDLVVTSGENEVFPPDLLIGKIKKIEKEEREVFQKAEVEPLVDYDKLEMVFLILD